MLSHLKRWMKKWRKSIFLLLQLCSLYCWLTKTETLIVIFWVRETKIKKNCRDRSRAAKRIFRRKKIVKFGPKNPNQTNSILSFVHCLKILPIIANISWCGYGIGKQHPILQALYCRSTIAINTERHNDKSFSDIFARFSLAKSIYYLAICVEKQVWFGDPVQIS